MKLATVGVALRQHNKPGGVRNEFGFSGMDGEWRAGGKYMSGGNPKNQYLLPNRDFQNQDINSWSAKTAKFGQQNRIFHLRSTKGGNC